MSRKYEGLPEPLRREVLERDQYRCRWCGVTNVHLDLHHVRYRRGYADDVAENLISLCRRHHELAHGIKHAGAAYTLTKAEAQEVLFALVSTPGQTGAALYRSIKRSRS